MRRTIVHRAEGPRQQLGPYGIETLIARAEEGTLTAYRVHIAPGERTAVSCHKVAEELYYVLEGAGTAVLDGQPRAIKAGELLRLPPGTTHAFITAAEPLHMLNIHSPGCWPDRDVYFVDGPPPAGFGPD
jgi:mannose-6-phosphate isomerase-like protein (cupin superfamily)